MAENDKENGQNAFPPVTAAESGQKLLQFLQRRLDLPATLLHRWLRTGQIRLNGKRVKPFDRLAEGDIVRLPPFAGQLAGNGKMACYAGPQIEVAGQIGDILAINKPAGLPTHGGTGHEESVASALFAQFRDLPFGPTPAHRLDRDTSGLLLCATSYEALTRLQKSFRQHEVRKEYLAWVEGRFEGEQLLVSRLEKSGPPGAEAMRESPKGKPAFCVARALASHTDASLVHLRLFTGRTHQIRIQLSSIGHPVIGDVKYGAQKRSGGLFLHSYRIAIPSGESFVLPPPWSGGFSIPEWPDIFEEDPKIREKMAAAGLFGLPS